MTRKVGPGREKLVQSAGALFAEAGFDGVTTKQLAAHAGLSIGALYHHFPSKLDAYRAALVWGVSRIAPAPPSAGGTPHEEFRQLILWFCSVISAETVESHLVCLELLQPHLSTPLSDLEPFASTLQRFQLLAEQVAPGMDREEMIAAIVSLSFGLARLGGLKVQVPDFARRINDPLTIAETVLRLLLK